MAIKRDELIPNQAKQSSARMTDIIEGRKISNKSKPIQQQNASSLPKYTKTPEQTDLSNVEN